MTVFSAASLTDILPALADDYAQGGVTIRFSFGASSALARQIKAGANADVIVSADDEWMDDPAGRDLLQPGSRAVVAGNRPVPIGSADVTTKQVRINRDLDLHALLGNGRLALDDPAHVPAGRYAQASLEKLGLWASVQDRLAPAESVRVAWMYVVRGEAPLGVVYVTYVRGVSQVRVPGDLPIDPAAPIDYPAAALRRASSASAAALVAHLPRRAARAIRVAHGFTVDGESQFPAP